MPPQAVPDLYAFWQSASTHRVRIALNMKDLAVREQFVDLDKLEQRALNFLALNPAATIPILVEDGRSPLTQSMAILEFLEETVPSPALLPADAHGRARVRSLASMLVTDTHPLLTSRVRDYLFSVGGFDEAAWRAWMVHWLTFNLKAIDWRLATESETGDFCHGDRPTLADICLVSILSLAESMNIIVDRIPTVARIVATCASLDAFSRAHPLLQEGAHDTAV